MAYIGQGIKQGTFKVLDTSGNTYNGSNTTFSLGTQVGAAAQLLVSHDGVIQLPGTDYTLASGGTQITFSTAPASGASIFIVEISGAVGGTVTPSDNSVGITQLNVSDGSNGQALTTNGSGTLSFSTISSNTPSSADGQALGSASLEWSDLFLADGGEIKFGNDQDVALIHNADKGLKLKSTSTSDDTPAIFTLQTGDTDIGDADVIGKIEFQAPDEGSGTDAILVGAAIQAVAVGDFSSSANAMELQFMTAESATASAKMRIKGDGKVGISPDGNAPDLGTGLHIKTSDSGAGASGGMDELVLENGSANCGLTICTANDAIARIAFSDPQDNAAGGFDYYHDGNYLKIYTAGTEVFRVANGFVLANTTSRLGTYSTGIVSIAADIGNTDQGLTIKNTNNHNSGGEHFFQEFLNSSGNRAGVISHTGSTTTAYTTSSDYRLKENVDYTWDATTRLKQLKPARFNWIEDDTNTLQDGFLAHEVQGIVDEAIIGTKDATTNKTKVVVNNSGVIIDDNVEEADWIKGKEDSTYPNDSTWEATKTVPIYQGIDQAKLVPLLVKTVQELEARIKVLEEG